MPLSPVSDSYIDTNGWTHTVTIYPRQNDQTQQDVQDRFDAVWALLQDLRPEAR